MIAAVRRIAALHSCRNPTAAGLSVTRRSPPAVAAGTGAAGALAAYQERRAALPPGETAESAESA